MNAIRRGVLASAAIMMIVTQLALTDGAVRAAPLADGPMKQYAYANIAQAVSKDETSWASAFKETIISAMPRRRTVASPFTSCSVKGQIETANMVLTFSREEGSQDTTRQPGTATIDMTMPGCAVRASVKVAFDVISWNGSGKGYVISYRGYETTADPATLPAAPLPELTPFPVAAASTPPLSPATQSLPFTPLVIAGLKGYVELTLPGVVAKDETAWAAGSSDISQAVLPRGADIPSPFASCPDKGLVLIGKTLFYFAEKIHAADPAKLPGTVFLELWMPGCQVKAMARLAFTVAPEGKAGTGFEVAYITYSASGSNPVVPMGSQPAAAPPPVVAQNVPAPRPVSKPVAPPKSAPTMVAAVAPATPPPPAPVSVISDNDGAAGARARACARLRFLASGMKVPARNPDCD